MWEGLQAIRKAISSSKVENVDKEEVKDGYQLRFVGKNYAKFITGLPTETLFVPNTEWNNQAENRNSQNVFITGDNLDALKHLVNAYSGQVDMIYIDPPYNTGSDDFIYKDNFSFTNEELQEKLELTEKEVERIRALNGKCSHSAWLTFMLPRLVLAKQLLAKDGAIFISIDRHEHANCKILCDEIFGEENYIDSVVWEKKTAAKGVPPQNMMVNVHEYVIAIQKQQGFRFNGEKRDEKGFKNPDNDPRGPWRESNIKSTTKSLDEAFTITNPTTGQKYTETWAFSRETLEKMISEGRILWKPKLPKQKEYLYEMTNENKALKSSWGVCDPQKTTVWLKHIMPKVHFDNPKPLSFMKYVLKVGAPKDAIILDFFAGSGTTAHAVMALNKEDGGTRRYIMVQIDEPTKKEEQEAGYPTIDTITLKRIKSAAKELGDASGFKHYKLAKIDDSIVLDKIDNFNPSKQLTELENMLDPLSGKELGTNLKSTGVETLLNTWLVDDGYMLTTPIQEVKLGNYTAYSPEGSKLLYFIEPGWNSETTKDLLNKIGKGILIVQRVVIYNYSFNFASLTELKTNLKSVLDEDKRVEIIERF